MEDLWIAKNRSHRTLDDQAKVKTDLATQATISIVLGLSAFLTFCVSSRFLSDNSHVLNSHPVSPTSMDWSICCSKTTEERCSEITRVAGHSLWMDSRSLQRH